MPVRIVHRTNSVAPTTTAAPVIPGNYAVASTAARPWSSTVATVSRPKTRRAKADPIVVHPIFQECANLTLDPTWKTIFTEASLGKLPRGFIYKDRCLTHKLRNKMSRLDVSSHPLTAMSECITFFRDKAGIMSEEDQRRAKEDFEDYLVKTQALCPTRWTEIKKKKIREVLISTFLSQMSRDLNLTPAERSDLRNKIYLGFVLGCFGNDQVILDNGYIRCIAGLEFDLETRQARIDYDSAPRQCKKTRRVDKVATPKTSFYASWIKYLASLEKRLPRSKVVEAGSSSPGVDIPTESPIGITSIDTDT